MNQTILDYFSQKRMDDAMKAADEQRRYAELVKAGGMIGSAISGVKTPDEYDDLIKQSDKPITDLEAMQKNALQRQQVEGQLQKGKEYAELNSPEIMSEYQKLYPGMKGVKSAAQARELAPLYQKKEDQAAKLAEISARAEESRRLSDEKKSTVKRLTPSDVLKINEGNAIPATLADIRNTLEDKNIASMFGPISGRMRSANPYDTEAKATDAKMRAASQQFGRYMEGGVLRKEDEEKYRHMFPQLSDTIDVAKKKLEVVNDILMRKQSQDVGALKTQGYNLEGLDEPQLPVAQKYEPDVMAYAQKHNISPEQALAIKSRRSR